MGKGSKKYIALLPNGTKVSFGHKDYQQYKDLVPIKLGGGLWTHKNHLDADRRRNYRKRHAGVVCQNGGKCIDNKYSPAWFSYHFLW